MDTIEVKNMKANDNELYEKLPFEKWKIEAAHIFCECVKEILNQDTTELLKEIIEKITRPKINHGDLAIPCFTFTKKCKGILPSKIAQDIATVLNRKINKKEIMSFSHTVAIGPYVNFWINKDIISKVVDLIHNQKFLATLSQSGKERVMIEYSQPNTHKAFHVGHMRNVAIGGFMIKLLEQFGHEVVAVNYFGDEGAHVAKCLWYLKKLIAEDKVQLNSIPVDKHGEWLGDVYIQAVKKLSDKLIPQEVYEAVKLILRELEEANPDNETVKLYLLTKQWSIDEFKHIYSWLNARFDYDFFESEVGRESKKMVYKYLNEGKFVYNEGAVGCDLNSYKLGFQILLKGDGTGLYATKDLELARRKFDQFHIDRSIYIVDAAQTLHFQQVFKTLQIIGYKQAEKCYHLAYGQVVLPDSKMSSRKGNVIYFNTLQQMLSHQIENDFFYKSSSCKSKNDFLKKYQKDSNNWSKEEIDNASHQIAIGVIKYGMLNHDLIKEIVFDLKEWSCKTGNTGPYNMYAYSRIQSIFKEVSPLIPHNIKPDYTLLSKNNEREILLHLNDFWSMLQNAYKNYCPSTLCEYCFKLSQLFNSYYENTSIKNADTPELQITRLLFITAIGKVIKTCLNLLGIDVLERM